MSTLPPSVAALAAAILLAGCIGQAPSPQASSPPPCGIGFTNAVGVIGVARFGGDLDWARIHEDLVAAGFDVHPDPTAVAGRDMEGDRFAMSSAGAYEVTYEWNLSEPWPSDGAFARANASWAASQPRFERSVAAFANATRLEAIERSWRPALISGTTGCS